MTGAVLVTPEDGVDVWHIGTMEPADRGQRGASLEGPCLSVSVDPLAWRRIARLGGGRLWRLVSPEPVLVDVYATLDAQEGQIFDWARRMGYVLPGVGYRAWRFDDEIEEWCYSLHATRADAENETQEDEGPAGVPAVEQIALVTGTVALAEYCSVPLGHVLEARTWMMLPWIDAHCPEALGPWWDEAYTPRQLSAPRGGVLPSRLGIAAWRECDWREAIDASAEGDVMRRKASLRPATASCPA